MHNAPPVVFPVGFLLLAGMPAALLALCAFLALVIWQVQAPTDPALLALAGLTWLLTAVLAVWWHRREWTGQGRLCWTGQQWLWTDPQGREQTVSVHSPFDGGTCLLLRLRFSHQEIGASRAGRTRWAWMTERSMPSQWHGFRCAVYSRPVDVA